ncbi:MAG: malto-oligosyltrehalose trehalohydrolase [Chloroflexi bacterium]|nr:malto-oligosyltrehalose trehalohydrolase [Chloroflexota bacterium]
MAKLDITIGATHLSAGRCRFRLWAPTTEQVEVHLLGREERLLPMEKSESGYHEATADGVEPGALYLFRLDGKIERPDPASRSQPQGVHGPSQVVARGFEWRDGGWCGLPLRDYIFYEIHVGTFTPEGTFEAVIPRLDDLKELGITAIELMPVAQFPGARNWGYDGVYPFAVQDSYGGPDGLKRLVDACHARGLGVVLDVVYNHLGPEGNYLGDFGPYFSDRYRTPWGPAINFDGPHSDEVRRFFIDNALYWFSEFHIDALRLDAVHAIFDKSAVAFLEELGAAVQDCSERLNRCIYALAESTLNQPRLIQPREAGGYGLDGLWNDDFHHALHALLSGDRTGHYQDFGSMGHLVKAFTEGFVYTGQYSRYWQRRRGASSRAIPASCFVVFAQNHDQVGNQEGGRRLSQSIDFEGLKLAAAVVLLSPFVPLLFMGEEYGETAPFPFFISHSAPGLAEAVRRGRLAEFEAYGWQEEPPDPQNEATFLSAKLDFGLRGKGRHKLLLEYYRELIKLRKGVPALADLSKERMEVLGHEEEKMLFLRRWADNSEVVIFFNFSHAEASMALPIPEGEWRKALDSASPRWGGGGGIIPENLQPQGTSLTLNPLSVTLLVKGEES